MGPWQSWPLDSRGNNKSIILPKISRKLTQPMSETAVFNVFKATVDQILALHPLPTDGKWAAAMGDALFNAQQYKESLEYQLG